ncbi:AAA family ATPase [Roseibium salinum]|nr:AAA family ATPase [Roseibium salinum]
MFDKGWMEDGMGRKIDFRNTLILLTSNVGTDIIMHAASHMLDAPVSDDPAQAAADPNAPDPEKNWAKPCARHCSTCFRRLCSAESSPFRITRCRRRCSALSSACSSTGSSSGSRKNRDAELAYGEDVVTHIVSLCRDPDSGGRMIDNILTNDLLPKLSRAFLTAQMNGEDLSKVTLTAGETGIEIQTAA